MNSIKRISAGMTTMPLEDNLIRSKEIIDTAETPYKERGNDLFLRKQIVELVSMKEMHAMPIKVSVRISLELNRLKP
jgi:hypothetical protein